MCWWVLQPWVLWGGEWTDLHVWYLVYVADDNVHNDLFVGGDRDTIRDNNICAKDNILVHNVAVPNAVELCVLPAEDSGDTDSDEYHRYLINILHKWNIDGLLVVPAAGHLPADLPVHPIQSEKNPNGNIDHWGLERLLQLHDHHEPLHFLGGHRWVGMPAHWDLPPYELLLCRHHLHIVHLPLFRPTSSMFYTYQTMYLYHPASLVFHFIGVYWLFGTLISWHKYFTSSAVCLWYFQESERLQPVKRGLKRSLYHVGSAAVDAFLMPIQWVLLMCYSISKVSEEEVREQEENGGGCTNCLFGIRECINQRYRQINRGGPSSAGLTNFPYFESCEISATVFAQNNYRFFNIGGTITIFLTLFVCIFWVMITYFIIYY